MARHQTQKQRIKLLLARRLLLSLKILRLSSKRQIKRRKGRSPPMAKPRQFLTAAGMLSLWGSLSRSKHLKKSFR